MATNYKDWMKEAFITVNQVFPHPDRKGSDVAKTLIPVDSMYTPPRELLPSEWEQAAKYAQGRSLVKLFTSATPEGHILVADSLESIACGLVQAQQIVNGRLGR